MTKSSSLYTIIKSLSPTEKAYFKKIASAFSNSSDKKTIQLFNTIEKQHEYDEEKIIAHINDKNYTRNFSRHKNYLFELVLHSQYNYHLKWSKNAEINHLTRCAEILIEKQHYKEADKLIRSLKKEAYEYEAYIQLYTLVSLQRKIPYNYHAKYQSEADLMKEQQHTLEILNNNIRHEHIGYMARMLWDNLNKSKTKANIDKLKKLINDPSLKTEKSALSTAAKINYNISLGGCYFVLGNFHKSYVYAIRSVELFQQRHQMIKTQPNVYINCVYNLFVSQAELYKFEEMFETMKQFLVYAEEPVIKKSAYFQSKIFERTSYLLLTIYTRTGEFVQAQKTYEHTKNNIFNYKLSPLYEIRLSYEMAYYCFVIGNYKESLKWLNRIIHLNTSADMLTSYHAKALSIIIHYELGNITVVKSQLKTFSDSFKELNTHFVFLLQHITEDTSNPLPPIGYKKAIKKVIAETTKLIDSDKKIKEMAQVLDILSWLESKINSRPMKDIMKEKALNKYGKIKLPD